jgi:small subunit ribosomal protein S4
MLNGRKTDVPSAQVKKGDSIQVRQRSFNLAVLTESLAQPSLYLPDWLTLDLEKKQASVTGAPTAESVPFLIDVQQVIEYYNTRI